MTKRKYISSSNSDKYSRIKYRRVGHQFVRDFVPTGSRFSTIQNSLPSRSPKTTQAHNSDMFPQDLGTNRLRSGFRGRNVQRSASPDSDDEDVVQVHDLETEDDETDGGITLNVQEHGDHGSPIVISDDDDDDEEEGTEHGSASDSELEEGEEREDTVMINEGAASTTHDDQPASYNGLAFVIDTTPSTAQLCLRDLSAPQLEDQIRYAFWHLPRDEIDLSRPVRCLHCQTDGHLDSACPSKVCDHCNANGQHETFRCPTVKRCQRCRQRGHADCQGMKNTTIPCDICTLLGHTEDSCPIRHYNSTALRGAEKLELWISCCACASRSHLVGDCQEVPPSQAARWSLRLLDPTKVVNLSVQTGSEAREREAENRNMRPTGMKIRGRANFHHADASRRDDSDSDELETFFSRPPPRGSRHYEPENRARNQYQQGSEHRQERYDRYNAPTDTYRPPRNEYYATDSFGQPRSRSPPRFDRRPYGHSRPQSPSSFNSYRPSDDDAPFRRSSPPTRNDPYNRPPRNLPPRPPPSQPLPARGFSMQLPTRKGSNPSLQSGSSVPPQGRVPPTDRAGKPKGWNKIGNNAPHMGNHQVQQSGPSKAERKAKNKAKKRK